MLREDSESKWLEQRLIDKVDSCLSLLLLLVEN